MKIIPLILLSVQLCLPIPFTETYVEQTIYSFPAPCSERLLKTNAVPCSLVGCWMLGNTPILVCGEDGSGLIKLNKDSHRFYEIRYIVTENIIEIDFLNFYKIYTYTLSNDILTIYNEDGTPFLILLKSIASG